MEATKLIIMIASGVLGTLSYSLLKYYNNGLGGSLKEKRWAFLLSIPLIIFTFVGIAFIFSNILTKDKESIYKKQMTELDNFKKVIDNLNTYYTEYKNQLEESSRELERLKKEHDLLKPIVESEKKSVDSILSYYSTSQNKWRWIEIGISFIVGLFVSTVYDLIKKAISTRN